MLISREELRFDFKGARFDLHQEADRRFLGWVFNQFLYGEVTGIQCGHWLYHAPHLNAAAFLAKQAGEELSHVRRILRILTLLGEQPAPAHRLIRFLSSGMVGVHWGEHVALEMALGEGLVLSAFYAMADTIPHPEIRKILEHSSVEEERHVEFGERETREWLGRHPGSRNLLLGQALLQAWVLQRFKRQILKKLGSDGSRGNSPGRNHPVLSQFSLFYDHALGCFERRIERLGLVGMPVHQMGVLQKASVLLRLPWEKFASRLGGKAPLLTATYLEDPLIEAEARHAPLS